MLTTLASGDVAFTGYQATAPDKISFVCLKPIDSGTVLTVTDNAWNGSPWRTMKGLARLPLERSFSAGTQIQL